MPRCRIHTEAHPSSAFCHTHFLKETTVKLIRLNQCIINPQMITTITLESGSCVVHFAGSTTPALKLNGHETTQLLSAMRSLLME